jgi:hypothetical protein
MLKNNTRAFLKPIDFRNVKNSYYKSLKKVKTSQTSTCSRTCTRARWTSPTYGRWTYECTKHGCNTEGKNQWTTLKCSRIGCAEKPSNVLNHSSITTTNNNLTMGNECLSWWQSWICSAVWWNCFYVSCGDLQPQVTIYL